MLDTSPNEVPVRVKGVLDETAELRRELAEIRRVQASAEFQDQLGQLAQDQDIKVLAVQILDADADTLRMLTDQFRQRFPSGVAVLASISPEGRPIVVSAVSEDLVKRGVNAVELVKFIGGFLGGGGGGRPTLAQAGGKDPERIQEALQQIHTWVADKLK